MSSTGTRRIPLARPWLDEREEELVLDVLRSERLSIGWATERLEQLVAERVGAPHAAAVSSGTTALHLLAHLARIGPGDEAILLTDEGFIADGSGENVFVIRDGVVATPDLSASILPGVTRDTVIEIARDLGYTVVEKRLIRTDLYLADEVFMTGTAAEVTPLRAIDDHEIGRPGPVTKEIQTAYLSACRGGEARWEGWLEYASRTPAEA